MIAPFAWDSFAKTVTVVLLKLTMAGFGILH